MDELISVMSDILSELREMNSKLDDIKGYGLDNSIADVCSKLDEVTGSGLWHSLSDVYEKLGDVESSIDSK